MTAPDRILVTGASGFVGRHLVARLLDEGHAVVAVPGPLGQCDAARGLRVLPGRDLAAEGDWADAFDGVGRVIHLAGIAHGQGAQDALRMQRVNRDGSVGLAHAAARAGIDRFVFVSTVAVHGHRADAPIDEQAPCIGGSSYARSKRAAELDLAAVLGERLCVVRPPLVHGPGAPGNPGRLLALVARGLPLPLASVDNRRSSISVANLCDALRLCALHPEAKAETFFVADEAPLSTAQLCRALARRMGRGDRLWPVPPVLLRTAAILLGRRAEAERVLDDFELDTRRIRSRLGWRPPFSQAEGLDAWVAGSGR